MDEVFLAITVDKEAAGTWLCTTAISGGAKDKRARFTYGFVFAFLVCLAFLPFVDVFLRFGGMV